MEERVGVRRRSGSWGEDVFQIPSASTEQFLNRSERRKQRRDKTFC
jgi:hypothetical protein